MNLLPYVKARYPILYLVTPEEGRAELAIQMGNLFPQTQQAVGNYTRNAASALAASEGASPKALCLAEYMSSK